MTKQEYCHYSGVFYDALFKVADWKKKHSEDNRYYSVNFKMRMPTEICGIRVVPDGDGRFWITSRNCANSYYELYDSHSNKVIRRVYTGTKGCIQSLLKSFLDVIEDELDGEGI